MADFPARFHFRSPMQFGMQLACAPGSMTNIPESTKGVPDAIVVAVITAHEPVENNRWITERWRVVGVVPASAAADEGRRVIRSGPGGEQYMWGGFRVQLRTSDADAYYFNLIGQNPSLQVVCQTLDNGELRPVLVTADYIDAMAHREAGAEVHAAAIPPAIYVLLEQFILEHYTPEETQSRRKRDDGIRDTG